MLRTAQQVGGPSSPGWCDSGAPKGLSEDTVEATGVDVLFLWSGQKEEVSSWSVTHGRGGGKETEQAPSGEMWGGPGTKRGN